MKHGHTVSLYFKHEEMVEFLKKRGYTIESVDVSETYSVYHNRIETDHYTIVIAYMIEHPKFENNSITNYEDMMVDTVFQRELKNSLLNL